MEVVSKDHTSAKERLDKVSTKYGDLGEDVARLEKELEEKKKSLVVLGKEVDFLKKRVQLRSAQEDLLNRRLADGWEDELEFDEEDFEEVEGSPERAEI